MAPSERSARRPRRPRQEDAPLEFSALLLLLGGGSILAGLVLVGRTANLDSLLLVSKAIFNVITGIKQIGEGAALMFKGLAQALGLFGLSLAVLLSVLAVTSGLLRILARLLPGLRGLWGVFAQGLNLIIGMLGVSLPAEKPHARSSSAAMRAAEPPARTRPVMQMRRAV